jgi:hypothetical protein
LGPSEEGGSGVLTQSLTKAGSVASRSHSEGSSALSLAPTAMVVQSGARRDVKVGRGYIVRSGDERTVCSNGKKANEVTCRSFYSLAC